MNATAFRLFLLFVISWFLHLPSRVPALGVVRMDLLLLLVIGGLVTLGENARRGASGPAGQVKSPGPMIAAILVYALVTVPLVQWPGTVLRAGIPEFVKAGVFYYFTARLITTPERLRKLLFVFVAAMTFRVVEPLYLHVTEGYWGSAAFMSGGTERLDRLAGAPHDVVNPNGLALVTLTVIPFLHYLSTVSRATRVAYVALLPILLWVMALTGSRSGMLGLAAVYGAIWIKSSHRATFAAAAMVVVVVAIPLLPPNLTDRYLSIFDSNTKNAATAEGRLDGLERDLRVAMRRPIFGHGLGTSLEASANFGLNDQRSHNLYTETLQELGIIGLGLLLAMLWRTWVAVRSSARALQRSPTATPLLRAVADALLSWLWLNAIFSFASYGLSSYEWYFAAGLAHVLMTLTASEQSDVSAPAKAAAGPSSVPSTWRPRAMRPVAAGIEAGPGASMRSLRP